MVRTRQNYIPHDWVPKFSQEIPCVSNFSISGPAATVSQNSQVDDFGLKESIYLEYKISIANVEINSINGVSTLPNLPQWSPRSERTLHSLEGDFKYQMVNVFGQEYLLLPFAQTIFDHFITEKRFSEIILTGQPGTGKTASGFCIFAKLFNHFEVQPKTTKTCKADIIIGEESEIVSMDSFYVDRLYIFVNGNKMPVAFFWDGSRWWRFEATVFSSRDIITKVFYEGVWTKARHPSVSMDDSLQSIIESLPNRSFVFSDCALPYIPNTSVLITVSPNQCPSPFVYDGFGRFTAMISIPPWTNRELRILLEPFLEMGTIALLEAEKIVESIGPIPRKLVGLMKNKISDEPWSDNEIRKHIESLVKPDVFSLEHEFVELEKANVSHQVFQIIPRESVQSQLEKERRSSNHRCILISAHVKDIFDSVSFAVSNDLMASFFNLQLLFLDLPRPEHQLECAVFRRLTAEKGTHIQLHGRGAKGEILEDEWINAKSAVGIFFNSAEELRTLLQRKNSILIPKKLNYKEYDFYANVEVQIGSESLDKPSQAQVPSDPLFTEMYFLIQATCAKTHGRIDTLPITNRNVRLIFAIPEENLQDFRPCNQSRPYWLWCFR